MQTDFHWEIMTEKDKKIVILTCYCADYPLQISIPGLNRGKRGAINQSLTNIGRFVHHLLI